MPRRCSRQQLKQEAPDALGGNMNVPRIVASLAVLAVGAAWAFAQDPEPPAPSPEPEQEAEALKPVKWNLIGVSALDVRHTGNAHKLHQYGRIPEGFVLRELDILMPARGSIPYTRVWASGTTRDSSVFQARAIALDGRLSASWSDSNHVSLDPAPTDVLESGNRTVEANVSAALTPKIAAYWSYRERKVNQYPEVPYTPRRGRTKSFTGGISGEVLGGALSLSSGDRRTYSQSPNHRDSVVKHFEGSYQLRLVPALAVEGAYEWARLSAPGLPRNTRESWGFNADWDLSEQSSLNLYSRFDDYDLNISDTAYVRQRFTAGAKLSHEIGDGRLQLGYRHSEAERVRADQAFVDVPKSDQFEGRVSGKAGGGIRYVLRGSWEHTNDAAKMLTEDPRQLFWDDRVLGQLSLFKSFDRWSGYATYTNRFLQNSGRDVELGHDAYLLGANYAIDDRTSGYFEYSHEDYRGRGVTEEGYNFDDFFPSASVWALGFDFAQTLTQSFSLGLTYMTTRDANPLLLADQNVRRFEITSNFRKRLSEDSSLEVLFAPWRHEDRVVSTMDVRSAVFGLTYRTKF